jgi:hypothetical protein
MSGAQMNSQKDGPRTSSDLRQLRQRTGLALPADAQLVYFHYESQRDELIQAKMVTTPAALERFLSENHLSRQDFSPANQGFLGVDSGGWDPQGNSPLAVAALPRENGRFLYIGFRNAGPKVELYIVWMTT